VASPDYRPSAYRSTGSNTARRGPRRHCVQARHRVAQLLLCGLFVARDQMATCLRGASHALPLTYAYDALDRVTRGGTMGARGALDVAVVLLCNALSLALGAAAARLWPRWRR
jgi:hypothetical protein